MITIKIPTIKISSLFRIGAAQIPRRVNATSTESLEGICLSVSKAPIAWRKIARLGGGALFRLTKNDGIFADILKILSNKKYAQLKWDIQNWAIENDLLQLKTMWKCWSCEDDDSFRYMVFPTREDAINECDYEEDDEYFLIGGPNDGPVVEEVHMHVGTQELVNRIKYKRVTEDDATEYAIMAYMMEQTELDGVWWNEAYFPENFSAPRGGIFPTRLREWDVLECDWSEAHDIEGPIK